MDLRFTDYDNIYSELKHCDISLCCAICWDSFNILYVFDLDILVAITSHPMIIIQTSNQCSPVWNPWEIQLLGQFFYKWSVCKDYFEVSDGLRSWSGLRVCRTILQQVWSPGWSLACMYWAFYKHHSTNFPLLWR